MKCDGPHTLVSVALVMGAFTTGRCCLVPGRSLFTRSICFYALRASVLVSNETSGIHPAINDPGSKAPMVRSICTGDIFRPITVGYSLGLLCAREQSLTKSMIFDPTFSNRLSSRDLHVHRKRCQPCRGGTRRSLHLHDGEHGNDDSHQP